MLTASVTLAGKSVRSN